MKALLPLTTALLVGIAATAQAQPEYDQPAPAQPQAQGLGSTTPGIGQITTALINGATSMARQYGQTSSAASQFDAGGQSAPRGAGPVAQPPGPPAAQTPYAPEYGQPYARQAQDAPSYQGPAQPTTGAYGQASPAPAGPDYARQGQPSAPQAQGGPAGPDAGQQYGQPQQGYAPPPPPRYSGPAPRPYQDGAYADQPRPAGYRSARWSGGRGSVWRTGTRSHGFEGSFGGCHFDGFAGPGGFRLDRRC